MADEQFARLELRIAELETAVRGVGVTPLGRLGGIAAFSSGSCTNNCTAACTIGCTSGCTGGCVAEAMEAVSEQPRAAIVSGTAISAIERFNQLSKT